MLVLALQFSRCDLTLAERTSVGLDAARRCGVRVRLPQNGREDGSRRRRRSREGPNPCDLEVVTATAHQCTNRCVSHLDRTNDDLSDGEALLRKEVIQPHLPVRLPCYDFTPITDPTFDGSLSCELGHRLRVLPTFVV